MRPENYNSAEPLRGTINYIHDSGDKPVFQASVGGPDETHYTSNQDPHDVIMRDGRSLRPPATLDREGFALVRHATEVPDLYDDEAVRRDYEPEIEALVRAETGAVRVLVFDHTRRSDSQATREARKIRDPATIVHNDYTERSARQRLRDALPQANFPGEAEALLTRRFAIINVWRPIVGPVRRWPMALCEADSIAEEDLIATERRSNQRVGEIQQVTFNQAHRWVTYPAMRTGEVLLIKTFDAARDGRARLSVHTAFDDPTSPPGAAPRESIETRTFAFFAT